MDVEPRAVVIPFGVPDDGAGLGLGLAALVHAHARLRGGSVALARLEARDAGAPAAGSDRARAVEAFLSPGAWRDAQGGGAPPASVEVIVTGAIEPPGATRGAITVVAFDARDGAVRATIEAPFEDDAAGDTVAAVLRDVAARLEGDPGPLVDLAGLGWDALESVLHGERAALFDPTRGAPLDRLAALLHFGRAVEDAPAAAYPARRLAALAVEIAGTDGPRLAAAARRALERALDDAPTRGELLDALCLLCLRAGDTSAAEARARAWTVCAPEAPRAWAALGEALRARRDGDGALAAVREGLARSPEDLALAVQRGVLLAERSEIDEAVVCWREVLLRAPLHPGAFLNLAELASARADAVLAHELVDRALAARDPGAVHVEVYRRAIDLAVASEEAGLPRASRVAALARAALVRAPDDPRATAALAHATAQMGDREGAAAMLREVVLRVPGSALAAEAQRALFALHAPDVAAEIDAVLRAAMTADERDLEAVASRARRLALGHGLWVAWFALGMAEKRRRRWSAARDAFGAALESAPGCEAAAAELAEVEPRARLASEPPPAGAAGTLARLRQSLARLRR